MAQRSELTLTEKAELRTRLGIRFSSMLEMSERDLTQLISLLEKDPLFQKMHRAESPDWKVFSRQRFPGTKLSGSFYDFNEATATAQGATGDMQAVLAGHEGLLELIQKVGRENFEKYFLYDDGETSAAEIATALNISEQEVRKIREGTDQALINSDYARAPQATPQVSPELAVRSSKVAAYTKKEGGNFEIDFLSANMARGVYKVNYDKLKQLRKSNALSAQEKKTIQEIVRWLELINGRKNLIYKILKLLPQRQKTFFADEDWDLLEPLTQRTISAELNVTPAAVCRAIQGRSVSLPSGTEIFLVDLFPSNKDVLKRKIAPVFEKNSHLSDEKIKALLEREWGVKLSRRSVNVYRQEIERAKKKR